MTYKENRHNYTRYSGQSFVFDVKQIRNVLHRYALRAIAQRIYLKTTIPNWCIISHMVMRCSTQSLFSEISIYFPIIINSIDWIHKMSVSRCIKLVERCFLFDYLVSMMDRHGKPILYSFTFWTDGGIRFDFHTFHSFLYTATSKVTYVSESSVCRLCWFFFVGNNYEWRS